MSKYTTTGKQTLIDDEKAAQKLSKIGNSLEKLDSVIYFEMWRNQLANHNTKNNAKAKQYDVVMMFKVMVLRQHYKLNHDQTEYQIIDCNSFKQLLEQIVDASFVHAPGQPNTPRRERKIKDVKSDDLRNDNPNNKWQNQIKQ